jgi:colanic acid/amylovoran/stewartan biosynthesis glycosyltransferase WcaL/AmsK/CpsK
MFGITMGPKLARQDAVARSPNERGPDAAAVGAIGHTVPEYLPRSATFIYTTLRFQRRFRSVVLAQSTSNLTEFPISDVYALAAETPARRRFLRGLRAFSAGYRSTYQHRIATESRRHGCVALHAHFGWSGPPTVAAGRRLRIPVVTTFYGRDISEPERGRRSRRPYKRLFAEGTLFFCEGPAMAAHLTRIGCPPEKIRIVRIGIDLDQFPFTARQRRRPLVLLQTGRFVEKKGTDLSIRAFASARKQLGPSELWLVGDGPLRSELEALVESLGVKSSVRFLGMVSHAEYQQAIQRAHVCLQPSRTASDGDTEGGAPTVLLEMQASGVPVLASRHADIPSVVPDAGELVEENDVDGLTEALVRLASLSASEWRARVERGRDLIERKHDARALAGVIETHYQEAMRLHANGL